MRGRNLCDVQRRFYSNIRLSRYGAIQDFRLVFRSPSDSVRRSSGVQCRRPPRQVRGGTSGALCQLSSKRNIFNILRAITCLEVRPKTQFRPFELISNDHATPCIRLGKSRRRTFQPHFYGENRDGVCDHCHSRCLSLSVARSYSNRSDPTRRETCRDE